MTSPESAAPKLSMPKTPQPYFELLLEPIRQYLRGLRRQRETRKHIAWIEGMQSFPARATSEALRHTLANRLTPEERLLLDRVESIREALCTCNKTITIAGGPEGGRRASPAGNDMPAPSRQTTISDVCRRSTPPRWCLLLYYLVRALGPTTCMHLGTGLGVSAAYHATALKLNQRGRILALESAQTLALLASDNFQALELDNIDVAVGPSEAALTEALPQSKTIDYACFGGEAGTEHVRECFQRIAPRLSERAVLVFDRTASGEAAEPVWTLVESDSKVALLVDLKRLAVAIVDPSIRLRGTVALDEAPILLSEPRPRGRDW